MKHPPFAIVGAVVLVALVSVAGCTGISRLTNSGSPTANELPPGVNGSGVANATALVNAHNAALADSGHAYRMRMNTTTQMGNQSHPITTNSSIQTRIDDGSAYAVRMNMTLAAGPTPQHQSTWLWANDSVGLLRAQSDNRTVYRSNSSYAGSEGASLRQTAFGSEPQILQRILAVGNFSVTGVDRSGSRTLVTLTADGVDPSANVTAESYNATVVVDSRGVVHHATERVTLDGSQITGATKRTVWTTYDLTDQSVDHVDKPSWASKALENGTS